MNSKSIFSLPVLLTTLLTCCLLHLSQAQAPVKPDAEYCDEAIPRIKQELLDAANAECKTMQVCIKCKERTAKEDMYVTLVVQPNSATCRPVKEMATLDEPGSRGDKPRRARFQVEIIQSPCFAGGTNLEVFVPGWGPDSREFSYLWEIDGSKAGHLSSVTCACGKEAKVRVTHLPSGESQVKSIKLWPCKQPTDK